eukprot:TRINITY_DN23338_c0_g1_i1.p1 TRINITY_DN23338_c0_g1~~TRINITY_DN23338_c0_g1_i1.p1  ORF type:complete len:711 (+),score=16.97 TRINITY_DN23338_c0_g1_i1:41-2173(+)
MHEVESMCIAIPLLFIFPWVLWNIIVALTKVHTVLRRVGDTPYWVSFPRPVIDWLSLDLRSLALYRICLGFTSLTDTINRMQVLRQFYSDNGAWTRMDQLSHKVNSTSLLFLDGSPEFEQLIAVIALLLSIGLIVGFCTRSCAFGLLLHCLTLYSRNWAVANGADLLIRTMFMVVIFSPCGAKCSVDSVLFPVDDANSNNDDTSAAHDTGAGKKHPKASVSGAYALVAMQLFVMYYFSFVAKSDESWRVTNTAVGLSFMGPNSSGVCRFLAPWTGFTKFLTWMTRYVESRVPFMLFVPYKSEYFRTLMIPTYWGLHLGFKTCLEIGLFWWHGISFWTILIPAFWWDFLQRKLPKKSVQVYVDTKHPNSQHNTNATVPNHVSRVAMQIVCTFSCVDKWEVVPMDTSCTEKELLTRDPSAVIVVKDCQSDNSYTSWDGLCHIFRCSPFLWPIANPLAQFFRLLFVPVSFAFTTTKKTTVLLSRYIQVLSQFRTSLTPNIFFQIIPIYFSVCILWGTCHRWFAVQPYPASLVNWPFIPTEQNWALFAPRPSNEGGWFIIPGTLNNGDTIDLFTNGGEVTWDPPTAAFSYTFSNQYVRKWFTNNRKYGKRLGWTSYGHWMCDDWNRRHPPAQQLRNWTIIYMARRVTYDGEYEYPPRGTPAFTTFARGACVGGGEDRHQIGHVAHGGEHHHDFAHYGNNYGGGVGGRQHGRARY